MKTWNVVLLMSLVACSAAPVIPHQPAPPELTANEPARFDPPVRSERYSRTEVGGAPASTAAVAAAPLVLRSPLRTSSWQDESEREWSRTGRSSAAGQEPIVASYDTTPAYVAPEGGVRYVPYYAPYYPYRSYGYYPYWPGALPAAIGVGVGLGLGRAVHHGLHGSLFHGSSHVFRGLFRIFR